MMLINDHPHICLMLLLVLNYHQFPQTLFIIINENRYHDHHYIMMNHDHDHNDHIDHDDHAASQVEEFLAAGCIKRGLSPVEHFIRFLNIFVM